MKMTNPVPLTIQLQSALNQPSLVMRCQEIAHILQEVCIKDASYILRIIVESIFGIAEESMGNGIQQSQIGGGWGLRIITASEHRMEYEAIRIFLSPRGSLLNLIYRISHDPFQLFPFPISLLPAKVRTEILEGNAGPFYTNKLQNLGPGKSPMNIMLNAFEFYIFHFGFFLVPNTSQRWSFFWTSVRDSLYPTLLEDYLSAYLSCDSSVPPGPPSPPVSPRGILSPIAQRNPPVQPFSSSGNLHNFGLIVSPIGRPFRGVESSPLMEGNRGTQTSSPLHCHSLGHHPEVNVWTSHIVIQVLMEIWINLCVPPPKVSGSQHAISQMTQSSMTSHPTLNDVFVPSSDHVRAVRMLIKHFHYFANSLKMYQPSPLDPLRRNIWSMCRKSVYYFLKHLFTHWPLDSSFRLILETWLSYIQPWRYVIFTQLERTPTKAMCENEMRIVEAKWKGFIAENILFYSQLFSLLLKRILRFDLASPKNAQILFRVAKVFSQENLIPMLRDVEQLWEANQQQKAFLGLVGGGLATPSSTPIHQDMIHDGQPSSPQTIIQLVRSHILEIEKQNYHYISMFSDAVPNDVYSLLKLTKVAFDAVSLDLNANAGYLTKPQGKLYWITSMWKGIFDAPLSVDYENTAEEMQRCLTHLDLSLKHFCYMFNIVHTEAFLSTLSSDPLSSPLPAKMEDSHVPDQIMTDVGPVLTNYGRCQLLSGMRRLDLKYEGDPDMKLICSFEVTFLVRIFYKVAKFINLKFATEISDLYYRRDFVGSMARVVMTPPERVFEYSKDCYEPPRKRVPKDLPPRISLRFLANKRWLIFLLFIYLFLRLIGFSFLQATFQLILPAIVTFVVCKAVLHRSNPPTTISSEFSTEQTQFANLDTSTSAEFMTPNPQKHLRF